MPERSRIRRVAGLLALVVAGEAIFFLPFVLARVFRPTLLDVFDLTNLELGIAFSVYGVVAMVAYLPSGPLADRFSSRKLIVIALLSTAAGGVPMAAIPSLSGLKLLYGYWGLTTIALFWGALIRATREWGGEASQGSAFGLLDGGRGLITAVAGSLMVALFAGLLPEEVEASTLDERTRALGRIIGILAAMGGAAAGLVWWAVPPREAGERRASERFSLRAASGVLRLPTVWLQALIILCAYVGFKATDDFSLYARDVLGMNEVEAARAGTVSLWMRPLGAIGAGLLADRFGAGRMTLASFVLLFVGSGILASGGSGPILALSFFGSVIGASLGIFALRGLYYAIMREGGVPLAFTGTAVGLVSVVGYTPDVFMGPVMGYLLDRSPGPEGHRDVFVLIQVFAVIGVLASLGFLVATRRTRGPVSGRES